MLDRAGQPLVSPSGTIRRVTAHGPMWSGTRKGRQTPMTPENVDDAPLFRYRVREIAEAKGINLTKLARLADVTRETAERYWNNKVTCPTQALIKLARALECKVEELIVIVNPDEPRPDGSKEMAGGDVEGRNEGVTHR